MGISESKKKIVIDNYFKSECDVNTSIKEAFTKGFELGLKKAPSTPQPKVGHWIYERCDMYSCSVCHHWHTDLDEKMNYCPNCGARMIEPQENEDKE